MRPTWDVYFLRFAKLASSRSTCLRRQHGAAIVKDNQILATGYNASPTQLEHCEDECYREKLGIPSGTRYELCRSVHAEQNAIVQAAKHGVNINGATIYITGFPCLICTKLIINSGISKIVVIDNMLPQADAMKVILASQIPLITYPYSCIGDAQQ